MNNSNSMPLTVAGAQKLRHELKRLKSEERPATTKAIAEARAHGDLSENAEYHAARERQGMIEARIRYLESIVGNCREIDICSIPCSGTVIFGVTLRLMDLAVDCELVYKIVGEAEADATSGSISITTPVAGALLGKKIGDVIDVETPSGERSFKILEIIHR